jgi:hypothetical protein
MRPNFAKLADSLRSVGVTEIEISELRAAMHEDEIAVVRYQGLGPRVADWISSMVDRASTGSWPISVHAGGTFLAEVISNFYGR